MIQISDEYVFQHIVAGDLHFGGMCYECTSGVGLFVVRGKHVSLCPWCILHRIDQVNQKLGGLPEDIETLRREAIQEVGYQRWKERMALSVDWNYLWKCHRCKHLMQRYEVRFIPAEEGASVTHHKVCYACYLIYCAENPGRDPRRGGGSGGLTQAKVSWK
jgi:hypothetical protein